jgi:HEAT repeat protein
MDLLDLLRGGDRRMVRGVAEVIEQVRAQPALFDQLIAGMQHDDPLVRMRSADAAEKLTRDHPDWLQPHKRILLNDISECTQQEVRWHVAQMLPRLTLARLELERAMHVLTQYLQDKSRIVQVNALQAMVELCQQNVDFKPKVVDIIQAQLVKGSPAVKARCRKLLKQLDTMT